MQGFFARALTTLAWVAAATAAGLPAPTSAAARAAAYAAPAGVTAARAACTWAQPGHNPFMGDVVAAVDRYQDIPAPVRARLKARMASRAYDEVVRIRRDSILGQRTYRAQITDMHFGTGQVCNTVDRSGWSAQAEERGLVYCEAGHCILVPTVCRNVSRIQAANGGGGGGAHGSSAAAPALADDPAAAAGLGPAQPGAGSAGDSAALAPSQVAANDSFATEALPGTGLTSQAWPTALGAATALPGDAGTALPAVAGPVPGNTPPGVQSPLSPIGPVGPLSPIGPLSPSGLLPTAPVPEPRAALLLLGGLAVLLPVQWRRRRRAAVSACA